jgi:hypothetical protein
MGCNDATCLAADATTAIGQTPGGAAKFVFGLDSAPGAGRAPSPVVALAYRGSRAIRNRNLKKPSLVFFFIVI